MEIIFSKSIRITSKNQRLQKIFIKIDSALLLLASLFIFGNCDLKVKTDNIALFKLISQFVTSGTSQVNIVGTPTFSPEPGTFSTDQSVILSTTTSGATIYYTLDGSIPTLSSTKYSGAISITGNGTTKTIQAFAVKTGMIDSAVTSGTYSIIYAPTSISFSNSTYTFDIGVAIPILTPVLIPGDVIMTSCDATPNLPVGLVINSKTCAIYGTPSQISYPTMYTIKGSNAFGNATTTMRIAVGTFTIGGTISGLNGSAVLVNNNLDEINVIANGSFKFNTALSSGSTYNVSMKTYLYGKICTVSNGFGSVTANVENVNVVCSNISYSLGGAALGLVNTGQTNSYATGDDGSYQKTLMKSYTDNGNGTVTDNVTGLFWQKCSRGQNNDSTCSGSISLTDLTTAGAYCLGLNLASKAWRIPTVNELLTLNDISKSSRPTIDTTIFPASHTSAYWSGNSYLIDQTNAWAVNDLASPYLKTDNKPVRCVSGTISNSSPSFTDNGDGTVTDTGTKLIWQKCSMGQNNDSTCSGTVTTSTWLGTFLYCNGLSLAGKTWRLPNRNELQSIRDYTAFAPTLDYFSFPNTASGGSNFYATSSTDAFDINNVFIGMFSNATFYSVSKSGCGTYCNVRCVSGP